jgi:hypothetical protein
MKSLKTWFGASIRGAALLWFAVHFTLTAIYVMPLTPAKMSLQSVLNVTIGSFFSQNWSLFAPNPASDNDVLLVRCIGAEEEAAITAQGLPSDGWDDISTPLWQRLQQNRFTAYDRMARPQASLIRLHLQGPEDIEAWKTSCRNGSKEACKYVDERVKSLHDGVTKSLGKIGSAYCREAFPTQAFTKVALRARIIGAVPWSKRYTAKPQVSEIDLGVVPMDPNVALTGIYRAKN